MDFNVVFFNKFDSKKFKILKLLLAIVKSRAILLQYQVPIHYLDY
jgi:hypothetical protein